MPPEEDGEPIEYLIPKGRHVIVQEGDMCARAICWSTATRCRTTSCRVKGVEALAAFLVNEIQEVYRLQGVKINDKHVEVIVRQMLQKVEITDPGDTTFLVGEQVDRLEFDAVNAAGDQGRPRAGGRDAGAAGDHQGVAADPVVHLGGLVPGDHPGADRRRVRRQGRPASGLKENVIVGRLIPAGSGGVMNRLKRLADEQRAVRAARGAAARGDR